jgi:uncharacterized protein
MEVTISLIGIDMPENTNIIIGQSHFIKTVEDLYEVMAQHVPHAKFGIAFSEASGLRLIRAEGNDEELIEKAIIEVNKIGAGHSFVIFMQEAFPIAVLNAIKNVPEVCRIYCATANPLQVIVAESEQGKGILGVIDGSSPVGIEEDEQIEQRYDILREFGYKV